MLCRNRKIRLGLCVMVLVVVSTSTWAEDEILLPPGSVWEYSPTEPNDPNWKTETGGWAKGAAPFGNVDTSVNGVTIFNYVTYWPEDISGKGDDFWVRTEINLTGYDLSTIKWNLGVDNDYTLYINGDPAIETWSRPVPYTFRWEYNGYFPEASLRNGVNIIAVALNDWGGATAFDMQVTGTPTVEGVHIPDPALKAVIIETLEAWGFPTDPIMELYLKEIPSLYASSKGIEVLIGLEYCERLDILDLNDNQITEIKPLKKNPRLKRLHLNSNRISDIQPLVDNLELEKGDEIDLRNNPLSDRAIYIDIPTLKNRGVIVHFTEPNEVFIHDHVLEDIIRAELGIPTGPIFDTNMEKLTILHAEGYTSQIKDLRGLESCKNLKVLNLRRNRIHDINALSTLTNLEWLYLDSNFRIYEIDALSGLTNLTRLYLSYNKILDISPLSGLEKLEWLLLGDNQIQEIDALSELKSLERLDLIANNIYDISPLSGLTRLNWLRLGHNEFSDISALSGLINLEELYLDDDTPEARKFPRLPLLSDISPLSGLTGLVVLSINHNSIIDISPLSGLKRLDLLMLNGNLISDIQPLVNNLGLVESDGIDLRNNPLSDKAINTDIPILRDRGVDVFIYPDLMDLVEIVKNLNLGKIEKSLIAHILSAEEALDEGNERDAIGHLRDFQAQCERMSGKKMSETDAGALMLLAEDMIKTISLIVY